MNFINSQNILIIISILALVKIARDGLFYLWLWQIKEYRTDRMRAYLRDEKNVVGKNILYFVGLAFFTIFYSVVNTVRTIEPYIFGPMKSNIFHSNQFTVVLYLILLFFVFTFCKILVEIKNKTLKRPKFTFRVLFTLLTIVVLYSIGVLYWIPASAGMTRPLVLLSLLILHLLLFYFITPFLITAIILFTNPFFNFQKKRIIKKAAAKMRNLKKIKVIGITGSYGKTSTKEFLDVILSKKYKVIKTTGNNNTNIGVARTVLNKVSDDYDYFICEMGAYKIGEIEEICGIAKPEIGILTGINEQHLDLFGSIENTIKAKFELIEALPESGLAVLNGDNGYIKSRILNLESGIRNSKLENIVPPLKKGARGISGIDKKIEDIILYSLKNISNIKVTPDYVEFIYKNQKFKANFLGRHYIENLLAAIIAAENLGMNLEEISEAVKKIKPSKFMMRKLEGLNNSIFIDDSYSANPDGVIAALNYLDEAYQDYKKIIIFPGIIELGKESKEVHKKLFGKIDRVCDVAYILDIGILGYWDIGNNCKFIFEKDFNKVANLLKNNLDKKTVVLFESRGAGAVMGKMRVKTNYRSVERSEVERQRNGTEFN